MKLWKTRNDELLELLGRIANALDRAYPPIEVESKKEASQLPSLGILTASNESTAAFEEEEDAQIKSREEKLLKEYKEYIDWRERNVTKGG